jgi:hypothetical protein
VVNLRGGKWYIVDGQHRIAALKIMGYGDQQVECEAYEGLSEKQEGALFLVRAQHRRPQALDQFRIAVFTGFQPESTIDAAVRSIGLRIGSGKDMISAVSAVRQVYDNGGLTVLTAALSIINEAFGGIKPAFCREIVVGMGLVVHRYGEDLNRQRLIDRLAKVPGGVNGLLSRGSYLARSANRANPVVDVEPLIRATQAIHDVDCDEGPNCHEMLSVNGRYGRYAWAALTAVGFFELQEKYERLLARNG